MSDKPHSAAQKAPVTRKVRAPRMDTIEREQLIVQKAIEYFAQEGFEGSTRELAQHIGITQSLLYKYFPSKQAIVDRVYEEVYVARWNPLWEEQLRDRNVPIEARLRRYYLDYAKSMLKKDWVRILIFAGLKQEGINNRLFKLLRERIFVTVAEEVRIAYSLPAPLDADDEEMDIELVWALHASIFYMGMRKWVYRSGLPKNVNGIIEALLDGFIQTMKQRSRGRDRERRELAVADR